jgi:Domain of unknown function (DUF6249)
MSKAAESGLRLSEEGSTNMGGDVIALVAVVLTCGTPLALMYTYYRVRKLRTEERLAALTRGAEIPMEPELTQYARSRRSGILLVSSGVGFVVMFAMIARVLGEPETLVASAFGILPLAVGLGYFVDAALIRRDLKMS